MAENGKLTWTRNTVGQKKFLKTSKGSFDRPEVWTIDIPCNGNGPQHVGILQNFVNAITKGEKLLAPAEEGIKSVELATAMLFSSFKDCTVKLPLDAKAYEAQLKKLIAASNTKKKTVKSKVVTDMSASFSKA